MLSPNVPIISLSRQLWTGVAILFCYASLYMCLRLITLRCCVQFLACALASALHSYDCGQGVKGITITPKSCLGRPMGQRSVTSLCGIQCCSMLQALLGHTRTCGFHRQTQLMPLAPSVQWKCTDTMSSCAS